MIAHQAFRYELDPSAGQRVLLAKHAGTARFAELGPGGAYEALRDLDRAFRNYVRARRANRYCGFPRYKRKGVNDAFRLTGSIHVLGRAHAVQLPRLGAVRTKEGTETFRGRILSATVRREADR